MCKRSRLPRPSPLVPPLRRSLIGRFIPESPDSSTAPCSLLSSCCAVNRWCFFFTLAEEKKNWTDRKVKAVVLLCYSGENNGDLCAIIFFAKCSRLFSTKVMILKHLCSKYLMFWKNCENMHAFHSLWWVLWFGEFFLLLREWFSFDFYSVFFVGLCEMSLSFGIIQYVNSHSARDKGSTNVGVWVFVGLNGDTRVSLILSLSRPCYSALFLFHLSLIFFFFFFWFNHGYLSQLLVFNVFLSWISQFVSFLLLVFRSLVCSCK